MARLVEPGRTIQAAVSWTNGGPLPFAPQARVSIRNSDWLATWLEGSWVRSPEVLPGQRGTITPSVKIPEGWDNKLIDVKVVAVNGAERSLDQRDDYFLSMKQQFQFADDGYYALNYGWDAYWACARRSLRHKGPAIHVWVGFGILPSLAAWDTSVSPWRIDPYFLNNLAAYGSDVWKGSWSDWGDDEEWSEWYEQTTRNYWGEPGCDFWPAGFEPKGNMYLPIWVVQEESPVDRRNRNEPPLMDNALVVAVVDGFFFLEG